MLQHRFGPFVLDTLSRRLLRDGRPVHVSPKAFCLLEMLVVTSPKAWSKRELQDRLWPEVVVVEANLPNLVAELRRALDDDATHPRYIRTLPRFGYAFDGAASPADFGAFTQCRLHWATGNALLIAGENILGRDPELDVVIAEPSVSRRHARITLVGSEVLYEDLGSKNGSYRCGKRLQSAVRLQDGDLVRVGLVNVTVKIYAESGSTQTLVQ